MSHSNSCCTAPWARTTAECRAEAGETGSALAHEVRPLQLWTSVSNSNTMAQHAAPVAAPCKTLGWKLPTAQDFHAPGRCSHASHSGTSSNTGVYDLGKQRKQPSETAGPNSLESNSCSGKCPLPHNSLQKGLVTSGTFGAPAFLFASCLNSQVPMFLQLQSSEIHKKIF